MRTKTKNAVRKYSFVISMMLYPAIIFLIFYVGVNFNSFLLAFQNIDIDGTVTYIGFDNFVTFFKMFSDINNPVFQSLIKSLMMYSINLVICMPLYIIFAFYLFKKFRMYKVFRMLMMVPSIVSGFIICLLFKKFVELALPQLMLQLGIENFPQLLSDPRYTFGTTLFYMIWISFSTSMLVYPNAMNSIGIDVLESAEIDGVNIFQELWHIVLPLIYPTISTFLITGVAGIFTTGGPLVAFWMFSAPQETQNFAYYMMATVMVGENPVTQYPILSAMGLVITMVSAPVTYLVKYVLDRNDPSNGGNV